MGKVGLFVGVLITLLFTGCANINLNDLNPLSKQEKYSSNKDVFMIVLDGSGSMDEVDRNGNIKLAAAKNIIKDITLKLDKNKTNLGLINFSNGCYSSKVLVKPNNNDFNKVIDEANGISASGKTPLAASLRLVADTMKDIDKNINIVIISDGEETCGGNPVSEINKLKNIYGMRINSFVVGYSVNEEVSKQLKELTLGTGEYFDAKDSYRLNDVLQKITTKLRINSDNWIDGAFNFKINFDSGSSFVKEKYKTQINKLANYLKENNYKIEIQGHTDSLAQEEYNQKLSEERASAVRKELIKQGINQNRVYAIGYGELAPIADNNLKEGRFTNRRVEAHIIMENGMNIDLINSANFNKVIPINIATKNSFVGYYKFLDINRNYKQYHAYLKVYANNQIYSAEFFDNRDHPITQNDVYWFYNPKNQMFTLDWTNQGQKGGGIFQGQVVGNTNEFRMQGKWNNGKYGTVNIVRISKEELECMEDQGEFKNNQCIKEVSALGQVTNLLKSLF